MEGLVESEGDLLRRHRRRQPGALLVAVNDDVPLDLLHGSSDGSVGAGDVAVESRELEEQRDDANACGGDQRECDDGRDEDPAQQGGTLRCLKERSQFIVRRRTTRTPFPAAQRRSGDAMSLRALSLAERLMVRMTGGAPSADLKPGPSTTTRRSALNWVGRWSIRWFQESLLGLVDVGRVGRPGSGS